MKEDFRAIAEDVLIVEAAALTQAAAAIPHAYGEAVQTILDTTGKLIVTGVGKSGLIGAKIAATLASTGTPSFFIHPTEAMHGDLGMIGTDDAVLAISYSGESEELSSILPYIKRLGIPLIGLTRSGASTLGRHCNVVLPVNVAKEACPLDVTPTSSTTLTLAMGDALAICLMHARDFKKEDFAAFHPGGALGKRLLVSVSDIMRTENLPLIAFDLPLREAIVTMTRGRLGAVLLHDSAYKLKGILTDGDLRRALMHSDFSLEVKAFQFATTDPAVISDASMLASKALVMMEHRKIQQLIITDAPGTIKGLLHLHDLIEKGIA